MNKHIQIREVPAEMHRALKARAANEGLSMSDYLKRLIKQDLNRPDWAAIKALQDQIGTFTLTESTTDIIRRERDGR